MYKIGDLVRYIYILRDGKWSREVTKMGYIQAVFPDGYQIHDEFVNNSHVLRKIHNP